MSALATDHERLTVMQACLEQGLAASAVFELSVRRMPARRNFLVAAGLEQALQFLKSLSFSEAEFAWLRDQGGFSPQLLEYARTLRFEGDVDAMPEGTVFFAAEPILRVTAPLPVAQLVESRLLNLLHFETTIASFAARIVIAAGGRRLMDPGLRRAHGVDAALLAARAAFLAGFDGSAIAEAARRFGIPMFDTLAPAWAADAGGVFATLASALPEAPTILIGAEDTEAAVRALVGLARGGVRIVGVRVEGDDLHARVWALRARLDAAQLRGVAIFVDGELDEARVAELVGDAAPVDGFVLGAWPPDAGDAGGLDAVYELRHYAGGEAPGGGAGARQVLRQFDAQGRMLRDVVVLAEEQHDGEALLQPCMRGGRRLGRPPLLTESRAHRARQLAALPDPLLALAPAVQPFEVVLSARLQDRAMLDGTQLPKRPAH